MTTRLTSPELELTDEDAVRAVLDGDRNAYSFLVRRYQDVLFRHALRMVGSEDEAADLAQRALVTGFQKLRRCRNPAKVGGWLFRIVSNLCKDHLKSPRREDLSLDGPGTEAYHEDTPAEDLERGELLRRVEAALTRLTPDQREAFTLKHVEDLSYEEMAELLDASPSALKMRVLRAREELRSLLRMEP